MHVQDLESCTLWGFDLLKALKFRLSQNSAAGHVMKLRMHGPQPLSDSSCRRSTAA